MNGSSNDEFDRLKAAFLAIVSHELRTPLTQIIVAASVLGDGYLGLLTPDQRQYLNTIEDSAEHLKQLVQDLIDFAQLQAEAIETLQEPHELNEVVQTAAAFYRTALQQKKLYLVSRLSPHLPPLLLDRARMVRVVSNLIGNAVNFTSEGGRIMVRTRAAEGWQIVDVADTGIGIPKEKQARIFDSFYQAADPDTRQVGGLGIGLAYTRRIVEAHRGKITFESIEGKGSIFSVWLPAACNST